TRSKRADYLPRFEPHIQEYSNNYEEHPAGGTIEVGTSYKLCLRLVVKERALTGLVVEVLNAPNDIFKRIETVNLNYAVYREGDNELFDILDYDTDVFAEKTKDTDKFELIFTLRYEDLIGNKYVQPVIYDLKKGKQTVLPFSVD